MSLVPDISDDSAELGAGGGFGWVALTDEFIVKFQLSELPYRVFATDLGRVFTCTVGEDRFSAERELYYPGDETVENPQVLLELENLLNQSRPSVVGGTPDEAAKELQIQVDAKIDGVLFEWKFSLELATRSAASQVIRRQLLAPLYEARSALAEQRQLLFAAIEIKDTEIDAYKAEIEKAGLRIRRRSSATRPFNRREFLAHWQREERLNDEVARLTGKAKEQGTPQPKRRRLSLTQSSNT